MARILLAEDYDDLRDMIGDLLRSQEHTVELCPDGFSAQECLTRRDFDLVILDWDLPKVQGIDVCRGYRAGGGVSPVLMLTGKKGISDKEEGFEAGADDYLTKPFNPRELTARIKALLRRAEQKVVPLPNEELEAGTLLAERYKIIEALGRGSSGIIYKAKHIFLNRLVAVKVLHPQLVSDSESVARFKREAQAISLLAHPNIIGIYDFGLTPQGLPYLVMDYSEGVSLQERIRKQGVIPTKDAIAIFLQACDALSHAHSRGVVHRDIKPGNIILVHDEKGDLQLRIVDFGIAKKYEGEQSMEITQSGDVLGSPLYMSPEQCMGSPIDNRTDIYSLGCVMYVCLLGQEPFAGDNVLDTMYRRTVERPKGFREVRPDLDFPQAIEKIVMKALERDLIARYQSAQQLKADLESLLAIFA